MDSICKQLGWCLGGAYFLFKSETRDVCRGGAYKKNNICVCDSCKKWQADWKLTPGVDAALLTV